MPLIGRQREVADVADRLARGRLVTLAGPAGIGKTSVALAVAGLVVALARPEATVAVPVEQASVVLVTDTSRSMQATDVAPSRLSAARGAAERRSHGGARDVAESVAPPHDRLAVPQHGVGCAERDQAAGGRDLAQSFERLSTDEVLRLLPRHGET